MSEALIEAIRTNTPEIDHDEAANLANVLISTGNDIDTLIAKLTASATARDELRDRLMADPELRAVVCPPTTWGDRSDRADVSAIAVAKIERAADRNDVTVADLVAAFLSEQNTMANGIEFLATQHGTDNTTGDPRRDGWMYFNYRMRDAVAIATAERRAAERAEREAERDAIWQAQGLTRCDRCGGAGGHKGWPGFTCFDCGGTGAVNAD